MPKIDIWAIPHFTEAVDREQKLRDAAFIGLNEWVNGIESKPFTLAHYNLLAALESPFIVSGKQPTPGDVAVFLWIISPHWREQRTFLDRWAQRRFYRSLRRINFKTTLLAIDEYIGDAFY